MADSLIERYIYAVTKRLPAKTRQDVSKELRSLIDDMLLERCGETVPADKDIRVVLTELGDPREMADSYNGESGKCLIGAPYYSTYKLVLKIVLCCTAFGLLVSGVVSEIVEPSGVWYEIIAEWLANIMGALTSAFAFVTLLFAVFYHKGVKLGDGFDLNDLPAVPKRDTRISRAECVVDIGLTLLFLAVFLAAPQVVSIVATTADGIVHAPVFGVDAVRGAWYILVLMAAISIARDSVKLLEGSYTKRVMIAVIAADVLSCVVFAWWIFAVATPTPEFVAIASDMFKGDAGLVTEVFVRLDKIILGLVIFGNAIDILSTSVKTLRA